MENMFDGLTWINGSKKRSRTVKRLYHAVFGESRAGGTLPRAKVVVSRTNRGVLVMEIAIAGRTSDQGPRRLSSS